MRARTRNVVAVVVAVAIVLALLLSLLAVFSDTAAGHAEMTQSAPRPSQVVGGVIDRVDMAFREPIRPDESNGVALTYPDGNRELADITVDRRLVRARFGALTEPGLYTVTWELLDDSDSEWDREEFAFTYDPEAASPEWLSESVAGSSGGGISSATVVLVVVIAVAVVLAGWLFWPRRRVSGGRRRSP